MRVGTKVPVEFSVERGIFLIKSTQNRTFEDFSRSLLCWGGCFSASERERALGRQNILLIQNFSANIIEDLPTIITSLMSLSWGRTYFGDQELAHKDRSICARKVVFGLASENQRKRDRWDFHVEHGTWNEESIIFKQLWATKSESSSIESGKSEKAEARSAAPSR